MAYLVFDIGGTTTSVAVAHDLEHIAATKRFKTPTTAKAGVKKLLETAQELLGGDVVVAGAAGGIRGQLAEDKRSLHRDLILSHWADEPIVATLEEVWQCPVWLENDTALAGLGEAVSGAGQGFEIVVYHSVSTGVGGVKIESGQIDQATVGFEPGHQNIDIDRTVLGDDFEPTLENLVSGRAVEQRMGSRPYDIPQSDALWDTLANYLAQGLRNSILYWSPEVIVLGGSMILGNPCIKVDDIRKHTVQSLSGFTDCPFITTAQHGDDSGLLGALTYLGQQEVKQLTK